MQFTIAKNVPLPDANRAKYPFREMEVGDSFYVPGKRKYLSATAAAVGFAKVNAWCKFASRKEGDGGRIWRVK